MGEETTTFDQVKAAATLLRLKRAQQVHSGLHQALQGLIHLHADPEVADEWQFFGSACSDIEDQLRKVTGHYEQVMQHIARTRGPEWNRMSTRSLSTLERVQRLTSDLARLREGDWGPVAARAAMELERAIESLEAGDSMPSPGP
jgi:septation ring formation regulator EzrA